MNTNDVIDTREKAHKTGSVIEKKILDEKVAIAIFDKLDNMLKWSFIQGYLESCGDVNADDLYVFIVSRMEGLLETIAVFADTPYLLEPNKLRYDDINAVDFLGKVYQDHYSNPKSDFYERYLKILTGKKSIGKCLVYRTCPEAIIPGKSRVSDVGYDLSIIRKVKALNNIVSLYDTGIKVRVPHGYYTEIVPRSSLSKSGYILANSVGIIDRSYNGNLYVALAKIDETVDEIKFPFRCCQLIFRKQFHLLLQETKEDLEATARGEGGFGSTG